MEKNVALITGGAQGIGKGIAKKFLSEGMQVVICDQDNDAGKETQKEYAVLGDILFVKGDVSEEQDVRKIIAFTIKNFGSIDCLINNAGTSFENPLLSSRSRNGLISWGLI